MRDNIMRGLYCLVALVLIAVCVFGATATRAEADPATYDEPQTVVYRLTEPTTIIYAPDMLQYLPTETAVAIEAQYERDEVCRIITAECGRDRELCYAVAQCLCNTCVMHGWEPLQATREYRYTDPAGWASDEALEAFVAVFDYGVVYEAVGNATLFYAPQYCESAYHESQRFVCEIHGVRFFEEA